MVEKKIAGVKIGFKRKESAKLEENAKEEAVKKRAKKNLRAIGIGSLQDEVVLCHFTNGK